MSVPLKLLIEKHAGGVLGKYMYSGVSIRRKKKVYMFMYSVEFILVFQLLLSCRDTFNVIYMYSVH